jgi:hypothetical protein
MVGHHFFSALVAYFGLFPFGHFAALYYLGVAEATNIPLTVVDVFKYFKDLAAKYRLLNEISRYSFALSFVVMRLIIWPIGSVTFWKGCVNLLTSGAAHSKFVVSFYLAANIFLTGLQVNFVMRTFELTLFNVSICGLRCRYSGEPKFLDFYSRQIEKFLWIRLPETSGCIRVYLLLYRVPCTLRILYFLFS